MGLDGVEMIIEWEDFFGIQIPDKQAERITTLQEATDYICDYLLISKSGLDFKDELLNHIQILLNERNIITKSLSYDDFVNSVVTENKELVWEGIAASLELAIPPPYVTFNFRTRNIFSRIYRAPQINFELLTFNQLIDGIGGMNYKKLVNNKSINTRYEVYISIMGITVDKLGVDFYELQPGKSFVVDLGMD